MKIGFYRVGGERFFQLEISLVSGNIGAPTTHKLIIDELAPELKGNKSIKIFLFLS